MRRLLFTLLVLLPATAVAEDFTYMPPGTLVDGSGTGRVDETVYVPDMRFPIEESPAFPNSQVYGHGGYQGPGGGQCDEENYSYPWWDNYCESRSWDMPLCPSGNGHQGQDIRPSTCDKSVHWTVAAESGQITNIGTYSVYLVDDNGTQHRYLHVDMSQLAVSQGQRVEKGDKIGLVSNDFGGTPTTIHLHYDINQNIPDAGGNVYVPTYMSLIESYEELLGVEQEPCKLLGPDGGTLDDAGPCATFFGNPQFWRTETGIGHDDQIHWTNGFEADNPSNWARWEIELEEAGRYNVEVNFVAPYNVSKKARYMVRANGQEQTIDVDQSSVDGWYSLGEFDFAAGGDQQVEVYDNTGDTADDQHITADAVRLTRMDGESGADMGGGDPDAGTGGNNGNNDNNTNENNDNGSTGPDAGGGGGGGGADAGTSTLSFDENNTSVNSGCCAVVNRPSADGLAALLALLAALGLFVRRR